MEANTNTSSSSRVETRRKRILERGSDRLALITGRLDSLPPPPPPPHHLHTASLPASIYQDHLRDSQQPPLNPLQSNASSQDEEEHHHTEFARCETTDGAIKSASIDNAGRRQPQLRKCTAGRLHPELRKCETHVDTTRTPALDVSRKVQPLLPPSTVREPLNSAVDESGPHREARPHRTKFFTANKISSSISASENIRILGATIIALLVLLSHLRIPLLRSNILATIITTRPVYLVLLTDVTILLARLLFWKQVVSDKTKEETNLAPSEDADSWAGLGTALETGLMSFKALTAAFMDCSIYLVVVICGLSLFQRGYYLTDMVQ